MIDLRHAFGFQHEPFPQDVPINDLFPIPGLKALCDRFQYALGLGAISVVTGEVGSGKSTSLRHVTSTLHPAEFRLISVIASTGTLLDLLRQICLEIGSPPRASLAVLSSTVRNLLLDIKRKKQIPLLVVDEAHLLRFEVFAQLHTLTQFAFDSQTLMPIILAGQSSLLDRLLFHTSRPLASRVVGRSHLTPSTTCAAILLTISNSPPEAPRLLVHPTCSATPPSPPSIRAPAVCCAVPIISPAAPSSLPLARTAPKSPPSTSGSPPPRSSKP